MKRIGMAVPFVCVLAGCTSAKGPSIERQVSGLTGCNGVASSTIPSDGDYYLTTFGAGSDSGTMSCGSNTDHGSWYYAASRQRYGCGSRVKIEANGKCVVAQTDDYGPDVCVEDAAGGPIMDVSPLVSQDLFGSTSAGWSDHFLVHVALVDDTTALGPCAAATKGFIKGVVYLDPDLDHHLAGAKVAVENGPSAVYDGTTVWSFELAPGTYKVTATLQGYQPASVTRDVVAGEVIWGSIGLKPAQPPSDAATPNEPRDASGPDAATMLEAGIADAWPQDATDMTDTTQEARPATADAVTVHDASPGRDVALDSTSVGMDGSKDGRPAADGRERDGGFTSGATSGCSCRLLSTGSSGRGSSVLLVGSALLLRRRSRRK